VKRAVSAVAWTLATWFGCGRVPKAPGTAGTVGAIPLYLLLARTGRPGVGIAAMVATFVGVWAASVVARELASKDPQVVVIDEVAGFLVTMVPVRVVSWQAVLSGFVLFRALDSLKPWPIRSAEKLPGGWGIVLDDVVAGVFGAAAMIGLQALKVVF
jgi:phosphatidylglycerophosphatase A